MSNKAHDELKKIRQHLEVERARKYSQDQHDRLAGQGYGNTRTRQGAPPLTFSEKILLDKRVFKIIRYIEYNAKGKRIANIILVLGLLLLSYSIYIWFLTTGAKHPEYLLMWLLFSGVKPISLPALFLLLVWASVLYLRSTYRKFKATRP